AERARARRRPARVAVGRARRGTGERAERPRPARADQLSCTAIGRGRRPLLRHSMLPGRHAVSARPRGGLGAQLAPAAASIVLTVAAAETITRVWGRAIPVFLIPSPTNCLRRSASLGMDFRPECSGIMDGAAFRTNALGLRGPEVVDDDRVRILAAGD